VLSSLKPTVEPAETLMVSDAARGPFPQVMALELTFSTGELFGGWRTAFPEVEPPAMTWYQMSEEGKIQS
jgi:hypothetical protein